MLARCRAVSEGAVALSRCMSALGYEALGDHAHSSLKGRTVLVTGSTE